MQINTKIIQALNPCYSRFNNYLTHYKDFSGDLDDFLSLDKITYADKVWVVTQLFTKEQNVRWSLLCASSVLNIFEEKCPEDKRPRLALEAVERYLNNPSEENRLAAAAATDNADAADAWAAVAAAAARAAARAAAYAAWAAAWAAQEELNLIFMVEAYNANE